MEVSLRGRMAQSLALCAPYRSECCWLQSLGQAEGRMAEFKRTAYPVLGRSLGRGKLYRTCLFFDSILAGADQTVMISQP